ncbi:hypothetical protein H489_0110650 [Curtobacterium flaccumfaciens UCD-AKU]|uniref:hypothetical protein n=1 Tax=Curtobacterium TaxID=2034 RepID=UPI000367FA78|nr:hypothetical protein [Curtobacterium flaccumfaciens]EYT63581.1 hypothetical protein H489_0110650 [Curtobacterium flaccumfaciens UCD-AKU]MCS6564711.1 hypothetical protein [Curtobacterium flaccumfaciens pv. flaccumfaciens]
MTNPGDPQQQRGYYGAGWSQPAPPGPGGQQPGGQQPRGPVPQYGRQPGAGAPYAPPRPPRAPADPRRAFAPGASVTNTAGALIAVVALVLVEFVSGLFGLLGTSLVVSPFQHYGAGTSLLGSFTTSVFVAPFPYYAGAFLALAFLTPIDRRSPLPRLLLRVVLAGAAGTVALMLVGVFTGSFGAATAGGSKLVIDVLTRPLQNGLPFTVMLLATATAAWLWLGRPRRGPGSSTTPGRPGTVRPADAVPPSTIQQQPQQQPPAPYGQGRVQPDPHGQYGGQYGAGPRSDQQQPPANPWGGPAPR